MAKDRNAEPGDGAKKSPDLKMAQMKLKISEYGNFGAGITNPVSKMSNLYLVQRYGTFRPHDLQQPPPPPKTSKKKILHHLLEAFYFQNPPDNSKNALSTRHPVRSTYLSTYCRRRIPQTVYP